MKTRGQDGFSLIELMVAMLVTVMVSGAVFALMTAGQGSFRREPALTDRQQNMRVAMDLIQRDISNGGAGMQRFEQVFTRGDGLNEVAPFLDARGPAIPTPTGLVPDHLQVIGTIDCPAVPIVGRNGNNLTTGIGFPACYPEPGMVMVSFPPPDERTNWGYAFNCHAGSLFFNFPPGQQPPKSEINLPNSLDGATLVSPVQLVRYELAPEPDGVPGLWRSARGGLNDDGAYVPATAPTRADAGWQLVARGIEDLQVRYRRAGGGFEDRAPQVIDGNFTTLTQEVEVTLWARAIGPRLQGQTVPVGASAGLPEAVRGSAVVTVTPRAALLALRDPAAAPSGAQWR